MTQCPLSHHFECIGEEVCPEQFSPEAGFRPPLLLHCLLWSPLSGLLCVGFLWCFLPVTLGTIPGGETESLGLCEQAQCCFQLKYPLGNLKVFNVIIMENKDYKRK